MEQIGDRLTEKLHTLTPEQLGAVEKFVESLQVWPDGVTLSRAASILSEPVFKAVWDNPEDDAYDAL
jgi:hypothetical protein